jgi:hypothetical protein
MGRRVRHLPPTSHPKITSAPLPCVSRKLLRGMDEQANPVTNDFAHSYVFAKFMNKNHNLLKMSQRKEEQEQQQISDIVDELHLLSLRTATLTHKLKQLQKGGKQDNKAKPTGPTYDHGFKRGDRVVIKNSYLGKRGTKGRVSYTTKTQITLQDEHEEVYKRWESRPRK